MGAAATKPHLRSILAIVSAALTLCPLGPPAQEKAPAKPAASEKPSDPVLDWDRDFDLILEERQGSEREAAFRGAKVADLEKEVKRLKEQEAGIREHRKIFEHTVMDEVTYGELAKLGVGNCSEAIKLLDGQLSEIGRKVDDLEDKIRRMKRSQK